jgi:hypothetical protein
VFAKDVILCNLWVCKVAHDPANGKTLSRCRKCKEALYCSVELQVLASLSICVICCWIFLAENRLAYAQKGMRSRTQGSSLRVLNLLRWSSTATQLPLCCGFYYSTASVTIPVGRQRITMCGLLGLLRSMLWLCVFLYCTAFKSFGLTYSCEDTTGRQSSNCEFPRPNRLGMY